jgi:hypothetical protein
MTYKCHLREKAVEEPRAAREEATLFNVAPAAPWFQPTRLRKFLAESL